jgi:hypothetical protein
VVAARGVRTGTWQLLEATGWADNQSCANLVAWSWTPGDGDEGTARHLVVVNLAVASAQALIRLPWPDLPGRGWRLTDLLDGEEFDRDGAELAGPGLFVDMGPGQSYLLAVS